MGRARLVSVWYVSAVQVRYGSAWCVALWFGTAVWACMGGAAFVWAALGMAVKEQRGWLIDVTGNQRSMPGG